MITIKKNPLNNIDHIKELPYILDMTNLNTAKP